MEIEARRSALRGILNPRSEQLLPLFALLCGALAVVLGFAIVGSGPFGGDEEADAAPGVVVTVPASEALAVTDDNESRTSEPEAAEGEVASIPFALPAVSFLGGTATAPSVGDASGMRIVIPKLGVNQSTVTMGIQSDGRTFQVPNSARAVAWYNFSGAPGSSSANAIFASHINYYGATGTFNMIRTLGAGDTVEIHQIDGTVYVYRVIWGKQIYKPSLSWDDVGCRPGYGCTSSNTITLITCGGAFDRSSGHYVDNTVVRAELIETRKSIS